ncbi:MAG: hypothetical protein ABJQ29_16090 [Luteolibacter sp.]
MTPPLSRPFRIALLVALISPLSHGQTQIDWNSTQNALHVQSDGTTLMDKDFRFELGVFSTGFTPTQENIGQWVANWNPAQRTSYKTDLKRYTSSYMVTSNTAPFTAGKAAYVWGFKGDPSQGEWILFRAASWTWPTASSGPPAFVIWDARDATVVLGTIHFSGTPSLMRTAAVSNLAPPTTTWTQWLSDELAGETLLGANQDADGDGILNIFEFVFGTSPKQANAPMEIPFSTVTDGGSRYLQLSVPRRSDRPANVTVEVSSDLKNWYSGTSYTMEVANATGSLVVRDRTPVSPEVGKRFIRVKVSQP